MLGLPLTFANPWILLALLSLPVIWWLLRLTPPRPQQEVFPPTKILLELQEKEETAAQSPWWLTLLRLLMAALVILAMAGPSINPDKAVLTTKGPVMIIMDDGWASAQAWNTHKQTALTHINRAKADNETVILMSTANKARWSSDALAPDEAKALLEASDALPLQPIHNEIDQAIDDTIKKHNPGHVIWLSDGLSREGSEQIATTLEASETDTLFYSPQLYSPQLENHLLIEEVNNEPKKLHGFISRAKGDEKREVTISARNQQGVVIARTNTIFDFDALRSEFEFDQPVELRNQFYRLEIDGVKNAAAVQLLDEANRRRLVGLISGEKYDQSQPLLSPLHYISNALEPFSDLRRAESSNLVSSIQSLIDQNVSAIMLADIGVIPEQPTNKLENWIKKGGMLIRFSGPRLAVSTEQSLLPVRIRPGDRTLGGALSWDTPKPLAPFEEGSPFFGIDPPKEVIVKKQLLALQEINLQEKTWATLEDGTPLVTAQQTGKGWIVLFHVGSDAEWSNLPLSGTFVEMLRRTINLSKSIGLQASEENAISLPPLKLLKGTGEFTAPNLTEKSLILSKDVKVSTDTPPGFYGTEDAFRALNLFEEETTLTPINPSNLGDGFILKTYQTAKQFDFSYWLLALAAILLIVDCIIVLWMAGALKLTKTFKQSTAALGILTALIIGLNIDPAQAQEQEFDYSAALQTKLAYVKTGLINVDDVSEAGLKGLTYFIASRTALEPGDPVGVDLSKDELSFYPLIYWPIDPEAELPTSQTIARVDAFMKQGGSILFDTRDQISGVLGGTSSSPAARTLQSILTTLDIPPLEPVPSDHVLTKSFYILSEFPGRYAGGDLWVETNELEDSTKGRPARAGDGVSSIMITSNDMAGAWAIDDSLRPLYPTVPTDPIQRQYAFRTGVNLIMYTLTGNYKADQVHLPALLERLGQ